MEGPMKPPSRIPITERQRRLHDEAYARGEMSYVDPDTGYMVFTRLYHERRGHCCGSGCRHCLVRRDGGPTRPSSDSLPSALVVAIMICLQIVSVVPGAAQYERMTIDTVLRLEPGTGQHSGQGPSVFPKNIFGSPDPRAGDTIASMDPRQICSIGMNGRITVGFRQGVVVDGPGPDFTVFENAFYYSSGKHFIEPATVEVSKDGIVWTMYPFDSVTYEGCAGRMPTRGWEDPFDPERSGGDAFDLATVGVDSIRWIRLTDISERVLDDRKSPYWDPTITGFDLDAVTVRHGLHVVFDTDARYDAPSQTMSIEIPRGDEALLLVHDVAGEERYRRTLPNGSHALDIASWPAGLLLVTVTTSEGRRTLKVLR